MNDKLKIIFDENPCINPSTKYLFIYYAIIFAFIIAFQTVKYRLLFNKPLLCVKGHELDCWSLSHLLCYTVIGFIFPHKWKIVFMASILWELFEYLCVQIEKLYYSENRFWCAKFSDIIINTLGFFIGLSLRIIMT